jgi:acyl-homoserine-lactone acylase
VDPLAGKDSPTRRGTPMRVALASALLLAVACTAAAPALAADPQATIRRTDHGIPHILASDYAGLGFGYGYAFAQDNICTIADDYVTVRGERSRFFGPDASYSFRANGTSPNNLNSDFFYRRIINAGTIESLLNTPPPKGPRPEIREGVRGYVAGYNKFLADTGVANLSDPTCRGKPWVRPISELDAYRRFYQLTLLASAGVAIDGIGGAQPPSSTSNASSPSSADVVSQLQGKLPVGGIGSNAVALGSQATDNGRGMLLGNPHFPWDGTERFYQAQLTIPGKVNVSGASLFGVPLVLIGYTANLAWSHTVSTAYRFTPFQETLVPGSPTTYLVDGQPRQMKAEHVTVQAKQPDGSLKDVSRTLYSTEHGPILISILGLPVFPWTPATAFAMGDANADNFRVFNHFFETDLAQSTIELQQVLRRNQGIPWVNTIGADSHGKAFYADISVTPNVPDSKAQSCDTALGAGTFQALRLPVLDGSRAACNWDNDPDAARPGIFGPSHMPQLFRDDYVTNSNDSYWLSNPNQPLTGFAKIIGDERTTRALRTRLGLVMVAQRLAGADGLPGNRFTLAQLQDMVFNNRQYAGELLRDQLAAMCEANPVLVGSNGPVDVSAACPVLRAWNLHDDLDSRGAILFRRFASRALASVGGVVANPTPFSVPFDANDPVNTPRGLNTISPQVRQALADAVTDLRSSNIPLDAPLRSYQYEKRGHEAIPIHGGPGTLGVFNAINVSWAPPLGYPDVPHGSSYVQTVQLTGSGCPTARSILTYSQSTDPTSPYFADQTRMFSQKHWVTLPFCEPDILAAAGQVTVVSAKCGVTKRKLAVRQRRGERVVRIDAFVNGKRARTTKGHRLRTVTLRKLPTTALTIKLVARTNTGRRLTSTYRIARCGAKPKKKTTRKKSSGKRAR